MGELTDLDVRTILVKALQDDFGMSQSEANQAIENWQGDHDYRAWQRGYQEAMMFASNLLLDAADNSTRR